MPHRKSTYSTGRLLRDVFRAYKKKKYGDAETILETILENQPKDPYPYFLQAVLCLFLDRFSGTHNMLDRIEIIDGDYAPAVQLRAFMMMKAATTREQAISVYADRIRKYPEDKSLQKGLRSLQNTDDFSTFQKHVHLKHFVTVPSPPKNIRDDFSKPRRTAASGKRRSRERVTPRRTLKLKLPLSIIFVSIFVVALSWGGYFFFKKFRTEKLQGDRHVETLASVELPTSDYRLLNRINRKRTPEFYTSPQAVKKDFNRSRHFIKKGRYNEAVLILNRIYNSNATFPVREKSDFLIRFIMDVEHRSYESVAPLKLKEKSWLYRGWGIRFRGKVTNLKQTHAAGSFTLLINHRESEVFDGIADVFFKGRNATLKNGAMVTVDGLFAGPIGKTSNLSVTAQDIRGKVESIK